MRHRKQIRDAISSAPIQISLLPSQKKLVQAKELIVGYIGGYGAGKTYAGAVAFLALCAKNPGHILLMAAPTWQNLKQNNKATFDKIAGHLITKKNETESWFELVNGCRIYMRQLDRPKSAEGLNIIGGWIDEGALCNRDAFRIILGRLRVKSKNGFRQLIITGTPIAGSWLQDEFDSSTKKNRRAIHVSTRENHHLADDYVEQLLESYSADEIKAYVDGQWVKLDGLVYKEFSRSKHIIDYELRKDRRVFVGIDYGYRFPAAVFLQEVLAGDRINNSFCTYNGLVVFDELILDEISTEAFMIKLASIIRKHDVIPSAFFVDPAGSQITNAASDRIGFEDIRATREELIRQELDIPVRYFAGKRSQVHRSVRGGIEKVRSLLLDGRGVTRLWFSSRLMDSPTRGVLKGIEGYVWRKDAQKPAKGEKAEQRDHSQDAMRYAIVHWLREVSNLNQPGTIRGV